MATYESLNDTSPQSGDTPNYKLVKIMVNDDTLLLEAKAEHIKGTLPVSKGGTGISEISGNKLIASSQDGDFLEEIDVPVDIFDKIESDIKSQFNLAKGSNITLTDTVDGKIVDMRLYGKSEQKQYSGKNFINTTLESTTQNGITCTRNTDGSYTFDGICTEDCNFILSNEVHLKAGDYTLVGCPDGGGDTTYYLQIDFLNGKVEDEGGLGRRVLFTSYNDFQTTCSFIIKSGQVLEGLLVKPMITTDLHVTYDDYEPYVGGISSPNPDYPQEIQSVVNPVVTVTYADGTNSKTATLPYTLNAIPVSSGGNVTIDGQQYIADYMDIENKQIHRFVDSSKLDPTVSIVENTDLLLSSEEISDMTDEEVQAFKDLATYYPNTNVFVTSDQLDGYTTFNYPVTDVAGMVSNNTVEIGKIRNNALFKTNDVTNILIEDDGNKIIANYINGSKEVCIINDMTNYTLEQYNSKGILINKIEVSDNGNGEIVINKV